jgi:hypothetical protein
MIPRSEWGARPPKSRTLMSRGQVTHLFLHHAAGNYRDGFEAMRRIQNFHMDTRGWADFAYSVGVAPDGQTFVGRGWDVQGGHTKGWNSRSVAICYLGWGTEVPPEAALRAIVKAADDADAHFGRKLVRQGHRDVGSTACPGDGLYRWWSAGAPLASVPTPEPDEKPAEATTEAPDPFALKPRWVRREDWQNLIAWRKDRR